MFILENLFLSTLESKFLLLAIDLANTVLLSCMEFLLTVGCLIFPFVLLETTGDRLISLLLLLLLLLLVVVVEVVDFDKSCADKIVDGESVEEEHADEASDEDEVSSVW